MSSRELREKRAQLVYEAGGILDAAKGEDRGMSAEELTRFDALHQEAEELKGKIDAEERQERTELELNQPQGRAGGHQEGPPQEPGDDNDADPRRSADDVINNEVRDWLTTGLNERGIPQKQFNVTRLFAPSQVARRNRAAYREQRAQGVGSDSAGGYTVPEGFHNHLETALLQFGGMRQVRSTILRTESGNDLPIPTSNDTGNEGEILAENTQAGEQDVEFGSVTLEAYKYTSRVIRVSYELLQDNAFDLPSYLSERLGERIGRITNRHFTVGTGSNQPTGVVTAAPVGHTAAAEGAITYLELVELLHAVDPSYRMNGEFMLHDLTLKVLKQLQDGEDRPLWVPGVAVREPDTILGYPYVVNNHMPQIEAGEKALLYGDFSKYHIRDVMDITLIRLDEVYAEWGQVAFLAFSRHDGDLVDAGTGPIQALEMGENGNGG